MEDDEGFVYPAFDAEKCCGCEACLRACPYGNELPREGAPIAVFGGHHKNASILEDSTSGGAFSASCRGMVFTRKAIALFGGLHPMASMFAMNVL